LTLITRTGVLQGADIAIIARVLVRHGLTSRHGNAAFGGAGVFNVARKVLGGDTCSSRASVIEGAEISIVTLSRIRKVGTACDGIAHIISTWVFVVAIKGHAAWGAGAVFAGIFQGTKVAVITGRRIGATDASVGRAAAIAGANISIVAEDGGKAEASAVLASIAFGARVAVITRARKWAVDTSRIRADIVGAWVIIVTG